MNYSPYIKKKKPGKKRNHRWDFVVYLLIRFAALPIQVGNVDTTMRVARFVGRCLHRFYHRGRKRALENLRISYPEKDEAWIARTARRSFEHLAMLVFDVFLMPRLVRHSTMTKYFSFDFNTAPELFKRIEDKQSVIMLTGHYGNFEGLGFVMATHGFSNYSVGRPVDNRYLDRYLLSVRERQGQTIINKRGATDEMIGVLESGGILGLVADQNGSRKDIFVDFFGRKAATYKSIGLLAMQYNTPIGIAYCRRINDRFQFKIGINRTIMPAEWKDRDDPLHWITAEYTKAIEVFVREDPEQYWWVHRRWKTRPPEERKAQQGRQQAP